MICRVALALAALVAVNGQTFVPGATGLPDHGLKQIVLGDSTTFQTGGTAAEGQTDSICWQFSTSPAAGTGALATGVGLCTGFQGAVRDTTDIVGSAGIRNYRIAGTPDTTYCTPNGANGGQPRAQNFIFYRQANIQRVTFFPCRNGVNDAPAAEIIQATDLVMNDLQARSAPTQNSVHVYNKDTTQLVFNTKTGTSNIFFKVIRGTNQCNRRTKNGNEILAFGQVADAPAGGGTATIDLTTLGRQNYQGAAIVCYGPTNVVNQGAQFVDTTERWIRLDSPLQLHFSAAKTSCNLFKGKVFTASDATAQQIARIGTECKSAFERIFTATGNAVDVTCTANSLAVREIEIVVSAKTAQTQIDFTQPTMSEDFKTALTQALFNNALFNKETAVVTGHNVEKCWDHVADVTVQTTKTLTANEQSQLENACITVSEGANGFNNNPFHCTATEVGTNSYSLAIRGNAHAGVAGSNVGDSQRMCSNIGANFEPALFADANVAAFTAAVGDIDFVCALPATKSDYKTPPTVTMFEIAKGQARFDKAFAIEAQGQALLEDHVCAEFAGPQKLPYKIVGQISCHATKHKTLNHIWDVVIQSTHPSIISQNLGYDSVRNRQVVDRLNFALKNDQNLAAKLRSFSFQRIKVLETVATATVVDTVNALTTVEEHLLRDDFCTFVAAQVGGHFSEYQCKVVKDAKLNKYTLTAESTIGQASTCRTKSITRNKLFTALKANFPDMPENQMRFSCGATSSGFGGLNSLWILRLFGNGGGLWF